MKKTLLIFLLSPVCAFSQPPVKSAFSVIPSQNYSWKVPGDKIERNIWSTVLFEGTGHDMEFLSVEACALQARRQPAELFVAPDEEHLLIVKSGVLNISFRDSTWSLGPGSIALLMPAERFSVQTSKGVDTRYYRMRYRSRAPMDLDRANASGGSFVRDWKKLTFRPHERGGVRSYFEKATAMSKRFEMHVTTLKPGLKSHDPHTHRAEEIILMLENEGEGSAKTEMLIGQRSFQGEAGDLYYIGSNLLHGIKNVGTTTCSYFAFQFE